MPAAAVFFHFLRDGIEANRKVVFLLLPQTYNIVLFSARRVV